LLARGLKLEAGGDYTRAGKELTELIPRLSGENLDVARVRIGAAAYLARDNEAAYKYLMSFQAAAPDAEAERLYYLLECQRRLNRLDEMNATLEKLAQSYPQSHWRLEALVAVGNYYAAHDQPETAQPLYRTCPGRSHAARASDALPKLRSGQPGALLFRTNRGIEIRLAHGARVL
jgi:tetratricopeptide (TPR) repeat protein